MQAGVDGFELLAGVEEVVATQLPGDAAVLVLDHQVFRALDQSLLDTIEVGAITERQARLDLLLGLDGERRRRLGAVGIGGGICCHQGRSKAGQENGG
ncbi:hypothetical protein D3C81_1610460 [compost metagenome]